jgi:hypothetical protein
MKIELGPGAGPASRTPSSFFARSRAHARPTGGTHSLVLPQYALRRIYAPGTRQNRAEKPGLYRFYLAHLEHHPAR